MFIWISELELSAAVKSQYILHEFPKRLLVHVTNQKTFFLRFEQKKK